MRKLKKYNDFLNEKKGFKLYEDVQTSFNSMIDYTSLTGAESEDDIFNLCERAKELGTASVCVLPEYVKSAAECLADSDVKVCTVISFPKGTDSIEDKKIETEKAIADGADECDMVLNYPMLQGKGDDVDPDTYEYLVDDVESLVDICHGYNNKLGEKVILKVIVESGLLSEEETEIATEICIDADADFIKTSTGKVAVGAEMNKVQIMKDTINQNGSDMKIKASGGIKTIADVQKFSSIVDRLGMGYASVDDINGIQSQGDRY